MSATGSALVFLTATNGYVGGLEIDVQATTSTEAEQARCMSAIRRPAHVSFECDPTKRKFNAVRLSEGAFRSYRWVPR